jgi:hypothetical protein
MRTTPVARARKLQEPRELQDCVNSACTLGLGHVLLGMEHRWPGSCTCASPKIVAVLDTKSKQYVHRPVTIFSHRSRHAIKVPLYRCLTCGAQFEPTAADFGYWPSTPTYPSIWFDMEVVEDWQHLAQVVGVSATGISSR